MVDLETWKPAAVLRESTYSARATMLFAMVHIGAARHTAAALCLRITTGRPRARHIALIASRPPTFLQTVGTATVPAGAFAPERRQRSTTDPLAACAIPGAHAALSRPAACIRRHVKDLRQGADPKTASSRATARSAGVAIRSSKRYSAARTEVVTGRL